MLNSPLSVYTARFVVFVLLRGADLYHTCYALSGLSVAQHAVAAGETGKPPYILGHHSNLLERTDPFYNVCEKHVQIGREQVKQFGCFKPETSDQCGDEGVGPQQYAEWRVKFSQARIPTKEGRRT